MRKLVHIFEVEPKRQRYLDLQDKTCHFHLVDDICVGEKLASIDELWSEGRRVAHFLLIVGLLDLVGASASTSNDPEQDLGCSSSKSKTSTLATLTNFPIRTIPLPV